MIKVNKSGTDTNVGTKQPLMIKVYKSDTVKSAGIKSSSTVLINNAPLKGLK